MGNLFLTFFLLEIAALGATAARSENVITGRDKSISDFLSYIFTQRAVTCVG